MKKSFSVVGNCQAPFLAEALLTHPQFSAQYEWRPTPPVHVVPLDAVDGHVANLETCDLVIHQPVVNAARFGQFETEHLRSTLAGKADMICVPSCYFNGYFPTLSSIAGMITPANLVNDMAVFHAFALGLPAADAAELLFETAYLPGAYYQSAWQTGLAELKEREAAFKVDIGLAEFLEREGKSQILMHQFNHPTRPVFNYLGDRICGMLGLEDGHCDAQTDLNAVVWPVRAPVLQALGAACEEQTKIIVDGNDISVAAFVEGSYQAYEGMEAKQLEMCSKRLPDLRAAIAQAAGLQP